MFHRSVSLVIRKQLRYSGSLATPASLQSQQAFESQVATNDVLLNIWSQAHKPLSSEDDTTNATNTLPIVLRSREAVFADVAKEVEDTGFSLKVKQTTTYFKSIIKFYRVGIQNVWRNRKLANEIKSKYHIESVGVRGEVVKRKIKNGRDLVRVLSALESMERIEQEALKTIDHTTLLSITRKEFQTVLRTERDFFKIPLFFVVLLVFAEMTPIVCTLIPEITPSTCVFPGLVKKMNKKATKAQEELALLRRQRYSESHYSKGSIPSQPVPKLPDDELRLLATSLCLVSRYLPASLYPRGILEQRVLDRYWEVKVDNYYLISGKQNLWDLNKSELIRCCLDRSLINFKEDDLARIGAHTLQARLFLFLGLMEGDKSLANVGVFGLNSLELDNSFHFINVNEKVGHQIHSWWVHKHKTDSSE